MKLSLLKTGELKTKLRARHLCRVNIWQLARFKVLRTPQEKTAGAREELQLPRTTPSASRNFTLWKIKGFRGYKSLSKSRLPCPIIQQCALFSAVACVCFETSPNKARRLPLASPHNSTNNQHSGSPACKTVNDVGALTASSRWRSKPAAQQGLRREGFPP